MVNMKNFTSVFLILFVITCNSKAQEVTLNYGLSVGYSKTTPNSSISPSSVYLYETTNDYNHYNVMAILEFATPSDIRIQTGLKYFKVGYSRDIHPNPDIRYFAFAPPPKRDGANYSYLAIPLNINYFLPFVSGVYLSGGIESVHLVSGNSFTESHDGQIYESNTKGDYRNQFFMYTVGIGFEYQLDVVTLFIEPEYSHSIWDATDNSFTWSSIIGEQISLYVGIRY